MSQDITKLYEELILKQSAFEDALDYGNEFSYGDETEDFFTSKELVKNKELLEAQFGKNAPVGNVEIEEDVHFKRYTVKREHKYTQTEMERMRKECECSIVHDYGDYDIYHISDEERQRNDLLSDIGSKLGKLKHSYRQVDQYIEAMRIVVQAWEILAKNNYVHTDEEFFNLVSEGKIVSGRIVMPKLKKMDNYNIDLIIKYISNPELDPKDLLPAKKKADVSDFEFYDKDETEADYNDDGVLFNYYYDQRLEEIENNPELKKKFLDEEGREDKYKMYNDARSYAQDKLDEINMERLLSPDEALYLYNNLDNPPAVPVVDIKRKLIKNYDRRRLSAGKKKGSKKKRYAMESLHGILNMIQSNPDNREETQYSKSYMLTHGMFDLDKPEKDIWEDMRFDGSWADDDQVLLYDLAVREELMKQRPDNERFMTYGDKELVNFFAILEQHGVNTVDLRRKMDCQSTTKSDIESKEQKKENKKIEAQLIHRITELNNNKKFKKIVSKAEEDLNKQFEDY